MTIARRRLVTLGCALIGIRMAAVERSTAPASQPSADEGSEGKPLLAAGQETLHDLWANLEKDEPEASRALLKLADRRDATVSFLKGKLKPLTLDVNRLMRLLTQLGKADQRDWQPAFEELEYFDPRLALDLETLMLDVDDSPTRQRMVAVMSDRPVEMTEGKAITLIGGRDRGYFNFRSIPGGSWWAEQDVSKIGTAKSGPKKKWTRAIRAIVLLEHFGTPDAVALLKEMSSGDALAQPTRVAREALERVGVKTP